MRTSVLYVVGKAAGSVGVCRAFDEREAFPLRVCEAMRQLKVARREIAVTDEVANLALHLKLGHLIRLASLDSFPSRGSL